MDRVAKETAQWRMCQGGNELTLSSYGDLSVRLHHVQVVHLSEEFVDLMECILFHAPLMSELLLHLLQHLNAKAYKIHRMSSGETPSCF